MLALENVSLKNYCTFKIGGNAKYLFVVYKMRELVDICKQCKQKNIKYKVIGFGANLLFDDLGFNGAIIVNKTNLIKFKNNSAYVQSGTAVSVLIDKCKSKNFSNLENLVGIPSTIGGAIVNNLGAFGTTFGDYVEYVVCYKKCDLTKKIKLKNAQCKFGYRTSVFKNDEYIICGAKINFIKSNRQIIDEKIKNCLTQKLLTQPVGEFSAGSVFKRSSIIPAKEIDNLGLKGLQVGDAKISTKHAGFIVNLGSATCCDVKNLIFYIKQCVKLACGVDLIEEIEFVDF